MDAVLSLSVVLKESGLDSGMILNVCHGLFFDLHNSDAKFSHASCASFKNGYSMRDARRVWDILGVG
jgi:hypothetical protein